MIKAQIVCDSLAPSGVRLTTFVLTYPRFIHAEFMTHRVFSRNASSSRAIPVKKSIQMVRDNPVIPLAFTRNQKGMQGGEALDGAAHKAAVAAWLEGRDRAVEIAEKLADLEVHKQYANRILEPYATITVVCTATDWDNFFALRCHPAAQPEICLLATLMWEAYSLGTPESLPDGDWHLPMVTPEIAMKAIKDHFEKYPNAEFGDFALRMSVARCARVSYLNHEGKEPTLEEDLKLYDRLIGESPIHASPAEHQAMACSDPNVRFGNFRGWIQYRKTLPNENVEKFEGPK
jgi:thymidylate synthase ThyX